MNTLPTEYHKSFNSFLNELRKRYTMKSYLHRHISTGNYAVHLQAAAEGFELVGEVEEILLQNKNLKETNEALEFHLRQLTGQ